MTDLPDDWLKILQAEYPKRTGGQGWGIVKNLIHGLIHNGESWDDILAGVKRYKALMVATGQERTPYTMQARTFFGPGEWWLEEYELPIDGSVELTLDQTAEQVGIERQPGEPDDSLKRRIGTAQTMARYKMQGK